MGARAKKRGAPRRSAPSEPSGSQPPEPAIEPAEIRAIRKHLGLSQAEAGELLGGGPRAFTKYEAGTVTPAAAVVTLLRLLESNPALIDQLRPPKSSPMAPSLAPPSPFQTSGEHVERFNQQLLPELLRRLLHAEALAHGLPADGIHVAGNVTAPDGGEDGRIEWQGGPDRTWNLPSRLTQFQLKAGPITPVQAGKELLHGGRVKPMVGAVLADGGHYRILCAHPYTKKAIESRVQRVRKAVRDGGCDVQDSQITFWDADQTAAWVNQHPAVALWVREKTQPGTVGPFHSWTHWDGHPDHDNSPWVPDERLAPLQARLLELAAPRRSLRLVGLSGIGKSRLALEALGADGVDTLRDIVMYADASEADASAIVQTVEALADAGTRAVVVVNRCSPKTHRQLESKVSRHGSQLSLATLDDEIPTTTLDEDTTKIENAPADVVEAIIKGLLPMSPPIDRQRLAHFAEGFPRVAIDVAKAWRASRSIAHAEDDDIVDAFVLGRQPVDPDCTRRAAMLLAVFGVIAVEGGGEQLNQVAAFRDDLSADDLRIGIDRLVERGVVRRRGRLRVLQPRPIAMRLAERQWLEWSPEQWERLLTREDALFITLRKTAAKALARLNTTSTAEKVVRHVCRPAGPPIRLNLLPDFAEVAPDVVLHAIQSTLDDDDRSPRLTGDARRDVVDALKRTVFPADTFEQAARPLLRLAATETENRVNDATGVFVGLFSPRLGNTAADGEARLRLLDELIDTADDSERPVLVDALIGSLTPMGWRLVGAEVQGSKPVLSPWLPSTKEAHVEYVTGCLSRLTRIAAQERPGWPAERARSGLGQLLRSWIGADYMAALEDAVRQVSAVTGAWPEAIESLSHALRYDAKSFSPSVVQRAKALLLLLRPANLEDRIHLLVTAMPWDYPADEHLSPDKLGKRQEEAVRNLALDLAQAPEVLEGLLPQLSRGEQRKALLFGEALGSLPEQFKPYVWRRRITRAALDAPAADRNLGLLIGYFVGIAKRWPRLEMPLKKWLMRSPSISSAFPWMCSYLGVKTVDVELAADGLAAGVLDPTSLRQWMLGGALAGVPASEAAQIFDALLKSQSDESTSVAVELIGAYSHAATDVLDGLRPQIRACVSRYADGGRWRVGDMASYHLEQLAGWMLAHGRHDADARATALDLAEIMVVQADAFDMALPSSVICRLLSDFSEVVWPRIGAAIVAGGRPAWGMAQALGLHFGEDHERPILQLPVETLFSWCHAHPETAPAFAASVLPILPEEGDEPSLHPTLGRLIDEFGEREDVLAGAENNMGTYSWVGSMTDYHRRFLGPFGALTGHQTPAVRHWAKGITRRLQAAIADARDHDEELDAEWDI